MLGLGRRTEDLIEEVEGFVAEFRGERRVSAERRGERRGEAFDLLNDVIGECECVVFVDLYREGGGEDHAAGHGAEKEILTAAALQLKVLFADAEETAEKK